MSYARFGARSDVYVYADYRGYLRCCACVLRIVETRFPTACALEAHLAEHVQAGHCVPESIMPAVRADWTDVTR